MDIEAKNSVDLYSRLYDFGNLYNSYMATKKTKRWKNSTVRFEMNALLEIMELQEEIRNRTYKMMGYNIFKIKEPKERTIRSIKFRDKVIQRTLCDYILEECFEPHLIYDNYACRKGKGTHAGLKRTGEFFSKFYRKHGLDGWILKCDVEKYFDSISHVHLKEIVDKLIPDAKVREMVHYIIDTTGDEKGLPLGNQTSQWMSVLFLSPFDHFVKEVLGIKYYVRYMDDFILIHHDKEYLRYCYREIIRYLDKIDLKLNKKSKIFPLRNGADFLGFHVYITETGKIVKKLRHDSVKRMKRKLKKYKELYREGKRTKEQITQSYNSWKNHAKHGDCYRLIKKMDLLFNAIFEEDSDGSTSS